MRFSYHFCRAFTWLLELSDKFSTCLELLYLGSLLPVHYMLSMNTTSALCTLYVLCTRVKHQLFLPTVESRASAQSKFADTNRVKLGDGLF